MSSDSTISVTVSYRGASYPLSLLPDSTLEALRIQLEELTSVPPALQKLLYKGKGPGALDDQATLIMAGLKNGMKIQMLGTTTQELGTMQAAENEQQRRDRIMRERALKAPTKLRSTGTSDSSLLNYRFHQLVPLPHLPNPSSALEVLKRLSDDAAIQHVMQAHKFAVGVLTELAPHENPELLGLNVNKGEQIKLRLRTNEYDGFRPYREVRRVLCHELSHNVWGDHDNNFKELNSQLNREVAQFERAKSEGTHYLAGGDMYEPASELEAEATAHILGGGGFPAGSASGDDSREERRRRVLGATMARLRKDEEELEESCGTAGQHSVS